MKFVLSLLCVPCLAVVRWGWFSEYWWWLLRYYSSSYQVSHAHCCYIISHLVMIEITIYTELLSLLTCTILSWYSSWRGYWASSCLIYDFFCHVSIVYVHRILEYDTSFSNMFSKLFMCFILQSSGWGSSWYCSSKTARESVQWCSVTVRLVCTWTSWLVFINVTYIFLQWSRKFII